MRLESLWALTVTFNPPLSDGRLEEQVRQVASQGIGHLLVDNGSANARDIRVLAARHHRPDCPVIVLELGRNVGLGGALNAGVRECRTRFGARWILTMDQDTFFGPDAFSAADRELASIDFHEPVAIVAFNYLEHRRNRERPYNHGSGPVEVNSMITSGSIVNASLFDHVTFDERLFLYFVDVDFCHKVRRLGRRIWVLRSAFIDHQEGRRVVRDGRPYFFLEPPRLYFVARNGCWIFRRYWSVKSLIVVSYLVAMNFFNDISPGRSLYEAARGAIASMFPDRFPPPRIG